MHTEDEQIRIEREEQWRRAKRNKRRKVDPPKVAYEKLNVSAQLEQELQEALRNPIEKVKPVRLMTEDK